MLFRFLILIHVCAAFPLKCPEPAQWSTRARSFCPDPSKYFCLKNDLINGYSENCTIFDFLQPGRKHVLRGGLDADVCSPEHYQPWPLLFYTNVSTNCIFLKSACNEEGLIVYDHGNRNTDTLCRCDYTRGYDFIVKPRNRCFCIPSEEDCSCYLKICQDSRYTLSPDYGCIHSKKNISINQCKPLFYERINRESNQSDTKDKVQTKNIWTADKYIPTVAILVTSISLAVIFLSYPLAKVFANFFIEHPKYNIPLEIQNMDKTEKERYIQILKTGTEKLYSIKVMILGKERVGKTSLMKNLLQEKFDEKEPPTDGIDIVKKCKVDIESKWWINCEIDTADKKLGRALRKLNEADDMTQSMMTDNGRLQDAQNITHSQKTTDQDAEKEGDMEIKERNDRPLLQDSLRYHDVTGASTENQEENTVEKMSIKEDKEMNKRKDRPLIQDIMKYHDVNGVSTETQEGITVHNIPIKEDKEMNKRRDRPLIQDSMKYHDVNGFSTENQERSAVHSMQIVEDKDGNKVLSNDLNKTSGIVENIKNTNTSNSYLHNTIKDGSREKYVSQDIEKDRRQVNTEPNVTEYVEKDETGGIENVIRKGLNAEFNDKKYADCIIMDFAGHKEYYSTHQTFLTRDSVYLIVFSLIEGDPFGAIVDETDNLGFWIDTIHCYAHREQTGQQEGKDSVVKRTISQTEVDADKSDIRPQIIMLCTGDDNPNDPKSIEKKEEWQEKFKVVRSINKRNPLIWGHVNFLSNIKPIASDLESLREIIIEIAETTPNWGVDIPVRWINFETVLSDIRKTGINVLTFENVKERAMKCSVQISSEKEVILFLKFQHERGNIIFYDETELKNCVILEPSWLVDAFKCLVYADECKNFSHNKSTLLQFRKNGKIQENELRYMIKVKNSKYKDHLNEVVSVMKKFDIIVEDTPGSFVCPSVIKKGSSSFKTICEAENINDTTCSRSPWLCMEFDFLPPALYNHLLVFCMRDPNFEKSELSHGIAIFCIKGSNKLNKFFLCKSDSTISLQIFSKPKNDAYSFKLQSENIPNAHTLLQNILDNIRLITNKYRFTVHCIPKIVCGETDYSSREDGYYLEEIIENNNGNCKQCGKMHNYFTLFSVWFQDPELIMSAMINKPFYYLDVQDTKSRKKCNNCGNMFAYKCYDCKLVLCKDCSRKHHGKETYQNHSIQGINDSFMLNSKFSVGDVSCVINDITCLPNRLVVVAVNYHNELESKVMAFSVNGKKEHDIKFNVRAVRMAVVGKNSVAVSLKSICLRVATVDFKENQVNYINNVHIVLDTGVFIHIESKLYVANRFDIVVLDMSGNITSRINLGFRLTDLCYDVKSQRIYCIGGDINQLKCIDKDCNYIFTFEDLPIGNSPRLTIDNEGNMLVVCTKRKGFFLNVIKVDFKGNGNEALISMIQTNTIGQSIDFHPFEKSVVVGIKDTVYIFKKNEKA